MESEVLIPSSKHPRIVIVGAGFAGLKLAKKLSKQKYQVVLIDKNNYHQFQPLFYQVATSGLEPSAISFPLRKAFQKMNNIKFRMAKLERIDTEGQYIQTDIGRISYDKLVVSFGATTNYFGNEAFKKHAIPMKSISQAIYLRNIILDRFEEAINESDPEKVKALMSVVIVGGGPTGVELAGALAEMKQYILPKDYPELNVDNMQIHLVEANKNLLTGFADESTNKTKKYLESLGVNVHLDTRVNTYDGEEVMISDLKLKVKNLIWAAGICIPHIEGMPESVFARAGRWKVNNYNQVEGFENIYALGDMAYMETSEFPHGHPQVAQVAMQQADTLAYNLKKKQNQKEFVYSDRGSMATIGRNLAVANLPFLKLHGFFAWVLWLFVHLMSILGAKNKLFVFINWMWSYFSYDQSLRLLIRPFKKDSETED